MGRGYDAAGFADALARVRRARPDLAVTTDVIVGFPGETDADFEESMRFVERCGFAKLHVFRYSRRAGTPAADRRDQVAPLVKAARAAAMRALSERLASTHATARAGQVACVLVERVTGDAAVGTTEDGLRVRIAGTSARRGEILRVTLRASADGSLSGEPIASTTGRSSDAGPRRG
jgi:threonylcarbamoyladenosine tRNA methylthiotransferase MtaB